MLDSDISKRFPKQEVGAQEEDGNFLQGQVYEPHQYPQGL